MSLVLLCPVGMGTSDPDKYPHIPDASYTNLGKRLAIVLPPGYEIIEVKQ